jgi:SAM-dependent methyltransferase
LDTVVVCPACLAPGILRNVRLLEKDRFTECPRCHRLYSIDSHGVVDFQATDFLLALPDGALEMWTIAQRRALDEYRSRSPGSVASPERGAARAFGRFIDVKGKTVLDVGSGTDYFPAYMHSQSPAEYVAMDPLPVEHQIAFTKVQAWAELMPFATASFDVLLCGTSLDHVVCLESALREMARVIRPGGTLYLWTALYVDTKWFANLLPGPCFVRGEANTDRTSETYRRDRERLAERIGNFAAIEERYGQLLVDQYHFRHLPVSFIKEFADFGFAMRNLEVWEHNFHEGAIFLNAFLALQNGAAVDDRSWQIDHQLGVWAMLAGLVERMVTERKETGIIRDVVASGHRQTELAREEIGIIREVVASGHRHTELARDEIRTLSAAVTEPLTGLGNLSARIDEIRQAQATHAIAVERISEYQLIGTEQADRLVQEQTRLADELTRMSQEQARLTQEQIRLAQEQERLAQEEARLGPLVAALGDQVQQLWRAAGFARLLSWMRSSSKRQ